MTESRVIHYPLYITPPPHVDITYDEFKNLSVYGLSTFLISWRYAIHFSDDEVIIYMRDYRTDLFRNHPLFLNASFWEVLSVEMGLIKIPIDEKVVNILRNKFEKYHFRKESYNIY